MTMMHKPSKKDGNLFGTPSSMFRDMSNACSLGMVNFDRGPLSE